MFKRVTVLFWSLIWGVSGLRAQDTLQIPSYMDYHTQRSLNLGILHPSLEISNRNSYGLLDLSYSGQRGDFHRAQEAFSKSTIQLHAKGYNHLERFRVGGDFHFERHQEDSLANMLHGGGFTDLQPYYYFATKHSHYIKQGFLARGRADYELIPERLMIGLGIQHRTYWTAGTVDPRPRTELFDLRLSPSLTFLFDQTKAGIDFHWSKGTEDIQVTYKNRNFGTGISDPSRTRYINIGYGTLSTLDTANLRKYNDKLGVSLSFMKSWQNWTMQTQLSYSQSKQDNSHQITKRRNYYSRSTFNLQTGKFNTLFTKKQLDQSQQIGLRLLWQDGRDENTAFSATNYLAHAWDIEADYSLHLKKEQSIQYEFGLLWALDNDYRKDGGQAHEVDYSVHTFGLSGSLHLVREGYRYRWKLSPYYRHPAQVKAIFPTTQTNVFTESIAIPDYLYTGAKVTGTDLRMDFASEKLFKSYETVIYAQYGYLRSFETVSRQRHQLQIGMMLVL